MLFNSYSFLLAFLPITVLGFFVLGRFGKTIGAAWLALCSLFFYGWWDYRYLPLLLASISVNYAAGGYIVRHLHGRRGRYAVIAAIAFNLLLLGYFKYANFFVSSAMVVLGKDWQVATIVLPIGISFFTFTQIAFLADAYSGRVAEYRFVNYLLFVTYFPHLIAGPVLHHHEMMPQFDRDRTYRLDSGDFAVGMSVFAIGLAKKVLIADSLAPYANATFATNADAPTLFMAWGGTLAYTFQLYFDFSGYSDMAIGISRLFGIRLPLNFNSPYKSTDISEFWRRWHMTLSRFLRDYLYIPLGGNRHGSARRQLNLLVTMVLGGLWHGAGWTFVIWGALHGAYLCIFNAWRALRGRFGPPAPSRLGRCCGWAITFLCVVVAWVYFRAPDLASANRLVVGLLGGWGVELPDAIVSRLGAGREVIAAMGIDTRLGGGDYFARMWSTVAAAGAIAVLAPNTQEIVSEIQESKHRTAVDHRLSWFAWRPNGRQAVVYGSLLALGVLALSRPTEFLYFQF